MSSWIELLGAHGITCYTQHHSRMKNAECVVACPLCGDDPSAHLNLFPDGSWYCLRNADHNGRTARFILRALGVSSSIVFLPQAETRRAQPPSRWLDLKFPEEFKRLRIECETDPFVQYLTGRGFTMESLSYLDKIYQLRVSLSGRYAFRIILPVYCMNRLVSWTSRIITNHPIRYLSLSVTQGALMSLTDVLYTPVLYDKTMLQRIVLLEGPFDAMKLNVCQNPRILGVSLFGKRLSQSQLMQLTCFNLPVTVALDADAGLEAQHMRDRIASQGIETKIKKISSASKDVGNMTEEEIKCLFA